MELEHIIKENLLDVKFEKKKYQESLRELNRLTYFANNNIFETKKEKEIFASKVFKQLTILESDGYYEQLLNESDWKGLPTWVWDTIKEKVVRKIVNFVAPTKKDSWAANVVVTTLGDIDINEIPKMGNCEFTAKQIAKGLVEGSLETVKREMGFTGTMSDVVRNALVETLDQQSFLQNMEEKLLEYLCPTIRKINDKFKKAGI